MTPVEVRAKTLALKVVYVPSAEEKAVSPYQYIRVGPSGPSRTEIEIALRRHNCRQPIERAVLLDGSVLYRISKDDLRFFKSDGYGHYLGTASRLYLEAVYTPYAVGIRSSWTAI